MSMFGFTTRRAAMRRRGGAGSGPVAGTSPTAFAVAPTVQYHPNSQTATLNGSNLVLDCADLKGLAPLLGLAAIPNNRIRNPNMAGAVIGTPGIVPNNWAYATNTTGLTSTVVGTGVENGIPYLDLRVFGTPGSSGVVSVYFDTPTGIAAATAQTWAAAVYARISAGSATNISSQILAIDEITSGGAYVTGGSSSISLTGSLTAFSFARTLNGGATVAFIRPFVRFSVTSGLAIDITLRLGLPDLEQAASATTPTVVGPVQMTDARGRKFWRFSPGQYLLVSNALASINHRQSMLFAVWRAHKVTKGEDVPLFSTRYSAYTDDTTNTNRTNGYLLRWFSATGATQAVGRLHSGTVDVFSTASNPGKFIPGAQLHVVGFASRAGASAGTDVGGRFYINNDAAPTAQTSLTGTADIGALIGAKGAASNGGTATYTGFDLYELAFWKGTFTDAQADAAASAMVSNWGIPTIDSQLILLGDSITECIDTATTTVVPGDNVATTLTAPGAELVPTNVRVINAAVGGSGIASAFTGVSLTAQRDDAAGPLIYTYPGGPSKNILTCNIGINDMRSSNGNLAAAAHYANFTALLNTATTGYLQRGFKVVAVTPTAINGDATGQSRIVSFRAMLADPNSDAVVGQFLTDVQANTGQSFDGLVSVLPICKIQYASSGTIFLDATDAADTTYYAGDGTHHQQLGYLLQATGGATPQYGYGAVL